MAIPARPGVSTPPSTRPRPLLRQPDGALVSVRTWDEFVGNTSGYSYIKLQRTFPGQMGSWRVDANSMSDFHNPDGTMKPAREILPCVG